MAFLFFSDMLFFRAVRSQRNVLQREIRIKREICERTVRVPEQIRDGHTYRAISKGNTQEDMQGDVQGA